MFADPFSMSQASQWSKTYEMLYKRGEGGTGGAQMQGGHYSASIIVIDINKAMTITIETL